MQQLVQLLFLAPAIPPLAKFRKILVLCEDPERRVLVHNYLSDLLAKHSGKAKKSNLVTLGNWYFESEAGIKRAYAPELNALLEEKYLQNQKQSIVVEVMLNLTIPLLRAVP